MPAFEWVHVQLHQQKGMISLSPPTICNSAPASCRVHRWLHGYRTLCGLLAPSASDDSKQIPIEGRWLNGTENKT
ncbi:Aldehyde dehydrogenase (plasmid) [Escherichia coli]|nr:Aldehyde dehydrogenase [Escherichia coli]